MQISNRANAVKPSATIVINGKTKQLKAQGIDVINLSVGEPDFDTPEFIKKAAIKAIELGYTKYTAVDGIPELKDAIIKKFKNENHLDYTSEQILVSCGAKQSFYNLMQAVLNDGDEVITPAPYWVSYPAMVSLAGGVNVIVKTSVENRFKITATQLEKAITPKTKILIINSPNNPTGMAYTKEDLFSLAQVLLKHPQVLIASDDMYEHILWGINPFVNIVNVCPELKERTIVCNGVSKSFAMTGWRIGYAAGAVAIIKAMTKIQSHSTSNPTSISQYAAAAALTGEKEFLHNLKKVFKERHDFIHQKLNAISGVICPPADGAFYLFPNVEKAIARQGLKDDIALCELILEKAHVAVVPGTEFGAPGFIRLSYATNIETLKLAVERMEQFIKG
ncbi:MAG TPA: pyridoxal phosphate-dependent aminotransferase [Coxiellaceae bacterium]|nr:MAG: aspartate aminotransferase [Gammaproteobacteria bacterium RIFCSPHIGHO2_12_FULL_36_30]HLB56463.1 pyridoxal phosphate-dependent aminotransferase [Coxiellaceae bacterium]